MPHSFDRITLDRARDSLVVDLRPGYSCEAAASSGRRAEADAIMKVLIEASTTDTMRFVVVTPSADDNDEPGEA